MDTEEGQRAVERLQELGLKTYEARCLVGLTRTGVATARELAEATDVPRTRVYDAVRVLEERGLVEIQHASPQRFRPVPVDEVIETLRDQFEPRISELEAALRALGDADGTGPADQEVWALSGTEAVDNRAERLVAEADEEVVAVVGEATLTDGYLDALCGAAERGVSVVVGATTESAAERAARAAPDAARLDADLEWLDGGPRSTSLGRVVFVDDRRLLVSVVDPAGETERAVVGGGRGNGLVVVARRLLSVERGSYA
jgi:sugar-specific transcriptional regulator TrmB